MLEKAFVCVSIGRSGLQIAYCDVSGIVEGCEPGEDTRCGTLERKAVPLQALGRQEVEARWISRQSAQVSSKIISPTHRPPLPIYAPGDIPGTHLS
jgi:hypothetical protein